MVRTTFTRLALAAALTCSLVACSAEAGPRTAPSPSSSPTPSPTTPPTSEPTSDPNQPAEPKLPAAAKAPTRAGAEAFVRYYIKLLNYASHTGDTEPLAAAANDCKGCRKYEALFSRTYARGGSFTGNLWSPYGFTVVPGDGEYVVLTLVKASVGKYRPRAGAEVQPLKADRYSLRFTLVRDRSAWLIAAFEGR